MDRRSLLSRAVLGATGLVAATAMGSLAPETAFAAASQYAEPGAAGPELRRGPDHRPQPGSPAGDRDPTAGCTGSS